MADFEVLGNKNGVDLTVGANSPLDKLRVYANSDGNKLIIGSDCRLIANIFLSGGAELIIGDRTRSTGMLQLHLHEGSSVSIGSGCLFSGHISFRPSDAHKIFDLETSQRINDPSPISIGNNVWVGEECLFTKGSRIPDGCIVGARSVITKQFTTENCIIAGHPAKVIREGVRWSL